MSKPRPPIVEELSPAITPERAFKLMSRLPGCLFLDSALVEEQLGRYSFLAVDPFDFFDVPADGSDGLGMLEQRVAPYRARSLAGLPPFQGGAAGLLAYSLGHSLEKIPRPVFDEFRVPAMAIGLYDVVIAWDHLERRCWIISQGFPEIDSQRRHHRATRRLEVFRDVLIRGDLSGFVSGTSITTASRPLPPIAASSLAPQSAVRGPTRLTSTFSEREYMVAVARVIDYILAGDVFQVNLSQRLLHPARNDSVSLYLRLRRVNPAPFAGYFDFGPFQVVSASPERFLRVRGREVETRPIKGTRQRIGDPVSDEAAQQELLCSEKDRAENVMIVDLLRNDLSRVCCAESLHVSQLCQVETYRHVLHLVSAIRGKLRQTCSAINLIRAAVPGGSITGAPKVRAMEIISELEPTARGAYCGSLGYLGFDGSLDLNLLIRTITAGRGWWQAPVGGGIVAQSDPRCEYEETWDKARGLVHAMV